MVKLGILPNFISKLKPIKITFTKKKSPKA